MTDDVLNIPRAPEGSSLADGIEDALRQAIYEGRLEPGFRLKELPLSEHFGCSTTPVREALRRLDDAGLVTLYPRRGAEVASIGLDELEHLYQVRHLLEAFGAAEGAARLELPRDSARVDEIHRILDQATGLIGAEDFVPLYTLDTSFHVAISALSGNGVLASMVERVMRQVQAVRARGPERAPLRPEVAHDQHLDILKAVVAGDAEGASRLVRRHLDWSLKSVRESFGV